MSFRILLTGKNGQVGAELCRLLPSLGELIALDHGDLDLAKPAEIRRVVRDLRPQLLVNAAAYTRVDDAENNEPAAYAVNAEAPAFLAEEAKAVGAALIHYSTDYVFDGRKNSPYLETDPTNPLSVYGKSKLAGEIAVQASGVPHLILRSAWIYASRGHNFLLTILRLSTQKDELRIVHDQIGAPTWGREIAAGTIQILAQLARRDFSAESLAEFGGIYHMTAGGETSWYKFAQAILEECARSPRETPWIRAAMDGNPQITRSITPITTQQYPTPARRPAYSVLSNSRLFTAFGIRLPDWRSQLRALFQEASQPPSSSDHPNTVLR